MNSMPLTTADLLRKRADDDHVGLLFEGESWTWREFVAESCKRAELLRDLHQEGQSFHVAVMLENVPEYLFLIAGAALSGATVVGVNLTHRGEELARDIRFTDCELVVTDSTLVERLDGLDLDVSVDERVLVVDKPGYAARISRYSGDDVVLVPAADDPTTKLLLLFTSGSTGAPKAVICSTERFAAIASMRHMGLGRDDVSFNSMPLFHGNALMSGWANPLYTGGTFALARRFSASRFLDDIIRHRATYFNYVGRSLSYILAQPERIQEQATALRAVFGTEASEHDLDEFQRRFGVRPVESYGSSEGALSIAKTPDTPEDALGLPPAGMEAAVIDPATLDECLRAEFDESGRILNPDQAIGELANLSGAALFEGYYKDPEAGATRVRGGIFFTGDLGYRDKHGYFYFAGRGSDRLRVDSENFAAAPVEKILARYPSVTMAAVYPVPDERTGDQVMATLQVTDPGSFDMDDFAVHLVTQPDLGTKWVPRYLRVVTDVPVTATRKIDKPALRAEQWQTPGPVWYRPNRELSFELLTPEQRERIEETFKANGRSNLLARPNDPPSV